MKTLKHKILLVTASAMIAVSAGAQVTYLNSFDAENLPARSPATTEDDWVLDTDRGVLNLTAGGGTRNRTAGVLLSGWEATDFSVSTEFTVNDMADTVRVGLVAFGTGAHNAGYLADWRITDAGGELRLLGLGAGAGFSAPTAISSGTGGSNGSRYRYEYDGVYNEGTLELTFSVFDVTETPTLIGSISAFDTAPLTGEYFGLRSGGSGASSLIDIDYDNFTVIPEPSTAGVAVGLVVLGGAIFLRTRRTK